MDSETTNETPDNATEETTETLPPEVTEETPAEQTEETEETRTESEESAEEPAKDADTEEKAKAEEKHRRAGGWQRKIERLERQNQLLLEQMARQGQQTQTQPPANGASTKTDPAAQVEAYVNNLVAQRLQAEREQERQAKAQAEFQRRTQEVRAANPDFDEVVMSADVPVSPALQQALFTSEHGPAIMYQLAKNPGELDRLNRLAPFDAAREIGRLEAKAASSTAAPTKTKPVFRPPPPPTTVGGSTKSTRDAVDLPLSEYKRRFRSGR